MRLLSIIFKDKQSSERLNVNGEDAENVDDKLYTEESQHEEDQTVQNLDIKMSSLVIKSANVTTRTSSS